MRTMTYNLLFFASRCFFLTKIEFSKKKKIRKFTFKRIEPKKKKALQKNFWRGLKEKNFFPPIFILVLLSTLILREDKGTKRSIKFLQVF